MHLPSEKDEFLYHVLSADNIATNPDKIKAVQDWPNPKKIK